MDLAGVNRFCCGDMHKWVGVVLIENASKPESLLSYWIWWWRLGSRSVKTRKGLLVHRKSVEVIVSLIDDSVIFQISRDL